MADPTTHTLNTSAMQIVPLCRQGTHHFERLVDGQLESECNGQPPEASRSSGFGLLESGSVSAKDEVNIMVKNVVDVVFGGLSYWSVGYGLSYGDYEPFRNSFVGFGRFFYDPTRDVTSVNEEGWSYAAFLFQLSLATTASTIVSGAVAERAKLKSYILLGCLVILIQEHFFFGGDGSALMPARYGVSPAVDGGSEPALCAVSRPWHALIIGGVSAAFSISVLPLLERLKVDDPVGIVPIHLTSSIWGMAAVGIFCERDRHLSGATNGLAGLLYSGDFTLLGVQLLCTLTVLVYSATFGLLALVLISKSPLGLRVTDYEEQIGADVIEHGLAGTNVARYVLEKPLSTRTFQTVTKAITKWKMLAKTKSRSKRMEQARQKRLTEDQAFTATDGTAVSGANGVPLTGNGAVHRRKTSVAEVAEEAMSPRANGIRRPPPHDVDVEAQAHTPRSKPSSLA
ncbi:ammonium transporter [Teladorsagia circumcincta]|uniref:Ammonium transporter n=1 Tax=Teladorsagia circumcincta TaxID=45464 RepID=A0A2G9UAH8_TELCI|nr:ammonium transporter [Teladorsagia circumcincta]